MRIFNVDLGFSFQSENIWIFLGVMCCRFRGEVEFSCLLGAASEF